MTRNDCESSALSARKLRLRIVSLAGMAATVAVAMLIRNAWETPAAKAELPLKRMAAKGTAKKPAKTDDAENVPAEMLKSQQLIVVAIVNGEKIERPELARECLRHFGEDVLESMINKRLIGTECQRRNIAVTNEEVKQEMDRMAERFGLATDQLLTMLKEERHI